MKRFLKNVRAIRMMILIMSLCSLTVFAQEPVTVTIPVSIRLTGDLPGTLENLTVVLTAEQTENPMPNGAVGGTYAMDIIGNNKQNFPELVYSKVGVYRYRIHQEKGAEKQGIYDENVYFVTVKVIQMQNGSLSTSVSVHKNDTQTEAKAGAIEFSNRYHTSGGGGGDDDGGGGGGSSGGSRSTSNRSDVISDEPLPLVPFFPFDVPLALPKTGTYWWLAVALAVTGAAVFLGGAVKYKKEEEE